MNLRQKKGQETKKKLLNTALFLFAEKGFDNVSVDEIVAKASSSKGAFYTHFKSKHEVFLEKFKEMDAFYEEYFTSRDQTLSAYNQLLEFFKALMTFMRDEIGLDMLRVIYINELNPVRTSTFTNPKRTLYQVLTSSFQKGIDAGEFRTDLTAEYMTKCMARAIRGLIYDWGLYKDEVDIVEESSTFLRYVLDGFLKR
ncbi:TetR/AcrR family transcriptional regulator [Alkalihalobacterium alkalinitrilicum]|uniref:TetR/AcrR family transcriptional regulator n=1 Tax=Alkalihalobacterium alkalinitrilicum TaxID=427920 RepID=UPI001303244C|nr:TetR/AcrR family transcriptional regulator [Alkalihalobacterium alkalinitrilicum]